MWTPSRNSDIVSPLFGVNYSPLFLSNIGSASCFLYFMINVCKTVHAEQVISLIIVLLQSHYPNRQSADGRRAKFWKIGRRRPIVDRRRHRFWLNFWSADDIFVEAPKLKVSLTDPPIFMGFVIGEASGDCRPMIGRQSADVFKKFTPWYRPKVARSSGVNRPTIARRSVDEDLSKIRRQTDADIGRHSADVARLSADHKMWFVLYFLWCMYPHYVWNWIIQ